MKHKQKKYKVGDKVGYWTLKKQTGAQFLCQCVCGTLRTIDAYRLLTGTTLSCGCKRHEITSAWKKGLQKGRKMAHLLSMQGLASKYMRNNVNKNSSTGVTGVSYIKQCKKYRAYITINRHQKSLGLFDDIEDAIKARKVAEKKYFVGRDEKIKEIKYKWKEDEFKNDR